MKFFIFISIIFLFTTNKVLSQDFDVFSQGSYWLYKFDIISVTKQNVKIIGVFGDTTKPYSKEKHYNQLVAGLSKHLSKKGIIVRYKNDTLFSEEIFVYLKIEEQIPNFTKLSIFNVKNPVCRIFQLSLIECIEDEKKLLGKTKLSISTVDFEEGIRKSTRKIAKKIKKKLD